MDLVNKVPKISAEDFESMLNSNINVSYASSTYANCVFNYVCVAYAVFVVGSTDGDIPVKSHSSSNLS